MANSAFTPSGITLQAANQTQQEAASSTEVYTSPGTQKYHPGHPKAWVNFTSVTTTAINASYNVASLTDHGAGLTTVNFTTAFSSANYCASGLNGAGNSGSGAVAMVGPSTDNPTTTAFRVASANSVFGVVDNAYQSLAFFGDQ